MACIMVSSPGVGGEGEGDVGTAIGISGGVAVDEDAEYEEDEEDEEGGEDGGGNGCCCCCSCVSGISGDSSFSEIEAGDEGRDKDAIEEAEACDSSALGVAWGVGVNATGVPKDDKEDVDEGSAAAAAAPGKTGGGGGGGTISPDTSGIVGNSPKSGNTGKFGMLIFLRDCLVGVESTEGIEDVEDG